MERVHQHRAAPAFRPHEEVPGQPHADDLEARPPRHLHVDHGERDGDAGAPVDHVVQEAVARVVVVLDVAAEALLARRGRRSGTRSRAPGPARQPPARPRGPSRRASPGSARRRGPGTRPEAMSSDASARSTASSGPDTRRPNRSCGSVTAPSLIDSDYSPRLSPVAHRCISSTGTIRLYLLADGLSLKEVPSSRPSAVVAARRPQQVAAPGRPAPQGHTDLQGDEPCPALSSPAGACGSFVR